MQIKINKRKFLIGKKKKIIKFKSFLYKIKSLKKGALVQDNFFTGLC